MTARDFPTADILSVATGILVTNRQPPIAAVYDLCGHVLGDTLWTHQLPAAATETTGSPPRAATPTTKKRTRP